VGFLIMVYLMSMHVMIDIETLGIQPGSIILSLGAVKFSPMTDEPMDQFYVAIDPKNSKDCGLTMDISTVLWWLQDAHSEAWELLVNEEKVDLASALEGFCQWYGTMSLPTWGNGAGFDNVLLRFAFDKIGMECPWEFRDDRCYRTLKNIATHVPMKVTGGTRHHGLKDAVAQASHMRRITKDLGLQL
jgi:hypothetical protein